MFRSCWPLLLSTSVRFGSTRLVHLARRVLLLYYQYNPSSFPFLSFRFVSRAFPTVVSKERREDGRPPFENGLVSSPGSRSIRNQDISIISHYKVPASLEFRQRSKRPSARNDCRRSDRLPRILLRDSLGRMG